MKAVYLTIFTIAIFAFLLCPIVSAVAIAQVTVQNPIINPSDNQIITASTNRKGTGIIFVVQPSESSQSWTECLPESFRLFWNTVPSDIKSETNNEISGYIISYKLVEIDSSGGGSVVCTFPNDFEGLNGEPNTLIQGEYKVIFVFLAYDNCWFKFKLCFACGEWFVVPESSLGTAMAIIAPMTALATVGIKRKINKKNH